MRNKLCKTVTFRLDAKTAKAFRKIKHGCRGKLLRELVKTNKELIERYSEAA